MLFSLEEVTKFINNRGLCFFSGSNKVIIYTLPTCETLGVLPYDGACNIPDLLVTITREVHRYLTDNQIPNTTSLNLDLLKLIFEDVVPEDAQTVKPTEWDYRRSGDDVIGG